MKLQNNKDTKELTKLILSAKEVHFEQDSNSAIGRVIFGPLAAPLAVIFKSSDYQHSFEIQTIMLEKRFTTSGLFADKPIFHSAKTEAELDEWERGVSLKLSDENSIVWTRGEETIPAE